MNAVNYLYFIKVDYEVSPIKIGITTSIHTRLKALQAGCPWPLVLIGSRVAIYPNETLLHKVFKAYRMKGTHREWYRGEPEVFKMIDAILNENFEWANLNKLIISINKGIKSCNNT